MNKTTLKKLKQLQQLKRSPIRVDLDQKIKYNNKKKGVKTNVRSKHN